MTEHMVPSNGLQFWCEDFGDPSNPALFLVSGGTSQATNWPDAFIDGLVSAGRRVFRFDNRDVGASSCVDFESSPYSFSDMALDVVGILDYFGIDRADFVGVSMGGMISQTLAIEHPTRVRTVTSIMSTPGGKTIAAGLATGTGPENMPGPGKRLMDHLLRYNSPPVSESERVERAIEMSRVIAGSGEPFDEAAARMRHELESKRATNIEAAHNHGRALANSADRMDGLRTVQAPTLVIHGTDDPVLPLPHGQTTAELVPNSTLMVVDGMGHDLPRYAMARIIIAVQEHLRAGNT